MSNCYDCAFCWLDYDRLLNNCVIRCMNRNGKLTWRLYGIIPRSECPQWKAKSGKTIYEWLKPETLKKLHDEVFSSELIICFSKQTKDYLEECFVENLKSWDVLLAIDGESELQGLKKDDFKEGAFESL